MTELPGMVRALESKRFGHCGVMGFAALVLAIGFVGAAFGQTTSGTIDGTVTDAKGAAMSGVSMTVHNDDTGIDKLEKTNDSGFYAAPLLQPGTYDVTATQGGFATVQTKNIKVQ